MQKQQCLVTEFCRIQPNLLEETNKNNTETMAHITTTAAAATVMTLSALVDKGSD